MNEKPVCYLVWKQFRRAADDVEDYYEVARPGDKCVDGSEPFPVYMRRVPEGFLIVPAKPTDEMTCAVDHDDCATPDAAERAYLAMVAASLLPKPEENSTALDGVNAWNRRPSPVNGRWRVFESVFDRTHFGIELEAAGNDDDPILYSMKIKRETVQAIVDAHNASLSPSTPS